MKKRFYNPYILDIKRRPIDFLYWQLGYYDDIIPLSKPPENFKYPISNDLIEEEEPKTTWINHSTFMIELDGVRILTDPIWSNRASPVNFIGPKRRYKAPVLIDDLPNIDIVLISHNHYDHLDAKTVKKLFKKFPKITWYVPQGVKQWFFKRKIYRVKELVWWEESMARVKNCSSDIVITSVPSQHNSGRGLFDFNETLWMGFVVRFIRKNQKKHKCFYFVGDTAYNSYDFKKIGEKFTNIDLCLCPIGTYKPFRFMRTVHASPEDAVNIHLDVKSKKTIGMHWNTFKLSAEDIGMPPYDLLLELKKRNINEKNFFVVEPGRVVNW